MNQYRQLEHTGSDDLPACDLRSDTVTRPCEAMRQAMYDAELGDDVYGEDPEINRLEKILAEHLGKEAGLFLPTGTQSNFTALLAHCGRGEEILTGADYHVYAWEAAGASVLGGMSLHALPVRDDGALDPALISAAVREDDAHLPVSRLLSLENTHNGKAVPLDAMQTAVDAGREAGLSVHLDGARFFNAITELGCTETDLSGMVDTVSICLSKGLGTPAGSVLVGPADLVAKARRWRKMLGGGMRQAGVLAATGLYALEHNVTRLKEDHSRAEKLADVLRKTGIGSVERNTNMVFLTCDDCESLRHFMAARGILIGSGSPTIRMVLHRDIDDDALAKALAGFEAYAG